MFLVRDGSERFFFLVMLIVVLRLLLLVVVVEFFIGLVGNGIFVVWSFGEWVRKFKGFLYNFIVLGLVVCRFFL